MGAGVTCFKLRYCLAMLRSYALNSPVAQSPDSCLCQLIRSVFSQVWSTICRIVVVACAADIMPAVVSAQASAVHVESPRLSIVFTMEVVKCENCANQITVPTCCSTWALRAVWWYKPSTGKTWYCSACVKLWEWDQPGQRCFDQQARAPSEMCPMCKRWAAAQSSSSSRGIKRQQPDTSHPIAFDQARAAVESSKGGASSSSSSGIERQLPVTSHSIAFDQARAAVESSRGGASSSSSSAINRQQPEASSSSVGAGPEPQVQAAETRCHRVIECYSPECKNSLVMPTCLSQCPDAWFARRARWFKSKKSWLFRSAQELSMACVMKSTIRQPSTCAVCVCNGSRYFHQHL